MMKSIDEKFKQAVLDVKTLSNRPDNETLLQLYGLYKQVTIGNINIAQPWAIQIEKRAKWDSWKLFENMDKTKAMARYVEIVENLINQN